MFVALLFLISANCFISTDTSLFNIPTAANNSDGNDEASNVSTVSAVAYADDSPAPDTSTGNTPPNSVDKCKKNETLTCGENEILDKCPTYCPSDFCPTVNGQSKACPRPSKCPPPACKCRFNYSRAQNGKCIPTRKCPPFTCDKPNEEYNPCPPLCPNDSCSEATPTGRCPLGRIGIVLQCRPACRCKKGYWRKDGICVPYNQCPGKLLCGPTEVPDDCPADCKSDYCPTSGEPKQPCTKPCKCPPPACKCAFNHRRAANGTCIPTTECPPFACKEPNQVYDPCPPICPTDDCSQATPDGRCNFPGTIGIILECNPKCRCRPGYWKKNGVCVPYEDCPGALKCPPGEVADSCPQKCNTDSCPKNEGDVRTCHTSFLCPKPACKCPFNQLRAANGTCIPASSCPPIKCTKPHEVYNSCPPACPSDDCKDATPTGKCPKPGRIGIAVECRPGCRCEKGYWRQNGTCVPFGQCGLDCSGPNEYYDCSVACDNVCKDLDTQSKDNCPIVNVRCNDKCYCKDGFARNNKNICIPISECPKKKCSKPKSCPFPNEVYTDCKKKCPSDKCSSVVSKCIPSKTCSPGCVCSPGYLRKADGEPCIPMCQCPELINTSECKGKSCPFPNEEFKECKEECPSDLCSSMTESCIPNDTCSPGCACSSGYYRLADGQPCIPFCQCPEVRDIPECKNKKT